MKPYMFTGSIYREYEYIHVYCEYRYIRVGREQLEYGYVQTSIILFQKNKI